MTRVISDYPVPSSSFKVLFLNLASILFCLSIALAFRIPELERRPMHSDEAVQAAKTGELFDKHIYTYDPAEFHGPTLYYFTLPSLWWSSAKSYAASSEFQYRIVPVVFSMGSILLLWLVADGLGTVAVFGAGMLTAVSPAMVFYSRYYIQEMLLVFFSFALIGCGWRWIQSRRWYWAVAAGLSAGLLHATKETCIIVAFSIAAGLAGEWIFRAKSEEGSQAAARWPSMAHAALALVSAVLISVLFYSSFFSNAQGPLDSVTTFGNYLSRASSPQLHNKRWYYYLRVLIWNNSPGAPIWTEAFILALATVGVISAFLRAAKPMTPAEAARTALARFLAFYTFTMTVVYSLIAYKTPWCALGFLHGSILLAGIGAAVIVERMPHWSLRALAALLLCAGAVHLGRQAYLGNSRYAFDPRNPYVYEHPSTLDCPRVGSRVEELAALHPDGRKMLVKVMAPKADYWPIPWYLRKMENVGYWSAPPAQLDAPVIIAASAFDMELKLDLNGQYQRNQIGLRPGVMMTVYVDMDLWKKFLAAQASRGPK